MTSERSWDVIVIGGGVVGAAVLSALASRGIVRTLLVERDTLASGVTGHSGAMVRVYHSSQWLCDDALESRPHFESFARTTGSSCGWVETGALYFDGASRRAAMESEVKRLTGLGAALELIDAPNGRERFPAFRWEDDDLAVWEPTAGFADPVATTRGWANLAVKQGAQVLEHAPVTALEVGSDGSIAVDAGSERHRGAIVVLAAGAWASRLVAGLGLTLDVFSRAIQTTRFSHGDPVTHPCWFDVRSRAYGRPDGAGFSRAGVSSRDRIIDPDLPGAPVSVQINEARMLSSIRIPALASASTLKSVRSLDAYTTSHRPLEGFITALESLYVIVGFSGTGFKLAPAAASRAASVIARRLSHSGGDE